MSYGIVKWLYLFLAVVNFFLSVTFFYRFRSAWDVAAAIFCACIAGYCMVCYTNRRENEHGKWDDSP
jgi:hypothetical protein